MARILLMLCVLTVVAISSAKSSYDVSAELYEGDETSVKKVSFCLSEVAAAAGFDSPLAMQEAVLSRHVFWGLDSIGGGELMNEYTHNNRGYYFSSDGRVAPKPGDKTKYFKPYFFGYFRANAEADEFACHVGQVAKQCDAGDIFHTTVFLINETDTVEFNISLYIKKNTTFIPPIATSNIERLDVIGETDVHVTITEKVPGYIRVGMTDIADEYGLDLSAPKVLEDMLYSCRYDHWEDKRTDELLAYTRYNALNFKIDDLNEDSVCPCAVTMEYYSDCFIVNNLHYDERMKELVATVIPHEAETERKYKAELYIVYDRQAFLVNLYVDVAEHKLKKAEDYKMVGRTAMEVEVVVDDGERTYGIDADLIAEKLNCINQDVIFLVQDDSSCVNGNFMPSLSSFYNGIEYSITTRGTLYEYKDFKFKVRFDVNNSKLSITHYHSNELPCDSSATYKTPLFFLYDNRLYEIDLFVTFVSYIKEFDDGEKVGSKDVYLQILDQGNTFKSVSCYMNGSMLKELTGASGADLTLSTYKCPEEIDGQLVITNQFHKKELSSRGAKVIISFLTEEGFLVSSSIPDDQKEYFNLTVTYTYDFRPELKFQLENFSKTVYTGKVLLVNMENKKYYTINYIIEPVKSIKNVEYVGEEEILLPVSTDGITRTEFDLGKAMDALGMEGWHLSSKVEWLANRSNKADFLYINDEYCEDLGGFPLDKDGCKMSKYEDVAFYVGYANEGDKHYFTSFAAAVPEDGQEYATRLALDYGNKRYVFRIRLMNEKTYTAVGGVKAEQRQGDGIIYDLCGKVVGRDGKSVVGLSKGIYIRDGKKFVVR